MSRMSEHVRASTSRNPKVLHGLYRDNFTFTLTYFMINVQVQEQFLAKQLEKPQHSWISNQVATKVLLYM
jgi:hypothetical protein